MAFLLLCMCALFLQSSVVNLIIMDTKNLIESANNLHRCNIITVPSLSGLPPTFMVVVLISNPSHNINVMTLSGFWIGASDLILLLSKNPLKVSLKMNAQLSHL